MKLNGFYLLYIAITISILIGCKKDWLDAKSDRALTVPATLAEFQGLLDNGTLMTLQYPPLHEIASDGHYITDLVYQNAVKNDRTDAYIWSKTFNYTSIITVWNVSYQKILIDNIVLDGLDKLKPSSAEQQEWNNIRGQALFHRANVFFELAQIYAPSYNAQNSNENFGIVLRLSSDITIPSKRSTVAVTYNQILMDLNEAKDLLPERPKILTRGSSSSVNALLARVYLSMQDYENAFIAANNCLKQYSSLLDYNDVSATANFIGRFNKEVLFHTNITYPFITTNCLIDQALFDLYAFNDLRRTRFFRQNANGTISFKGAYDATAVQQFNGLATDEVYLIRAECYARAGETVEAMKDLNDLMVKRWDKNVPYPTILAANAEEALIKILEERKKELILRGIRWMDLRRLNKDPRFAITIKRTVAGVEYVLEPNSYKYIFPIPDYIIEQTGIQQNPGWP